MRDPRSLTEPAALVRVLRDDGSTDPATDPQLPPATLLAMYRQMRTVRLLDLRMTALQRQGRVGFYGSCTGQEAVPAAVAWAARATDWVFPALRESSLMLARGFPLTRYVAQVFGTSLDVLKGRQMPSHMSGREVNLVSWSSSIGTQLTHAVGAAWAAKIRGEDCVAVAFCGDGATSTADFHAAMNFAAVFRLPVVIVCQNNHWAISVPAARQTGAATFAIKAEAYAIEHARVDGNDVIATYAVVSSAIERARRGGGPSFLECVTYRVDGHSSSDDPSRYRSEEEVASWRARDPIASLARHLRQRGLLDDASDASLTSAIDADIQRAVAEAEAAPLPDRATLFEDVYSQPPWHLQEQREELLRFAPAAQPN